MKYLHKMAFALSTLLMLIQPSHAEDFNMGNITVENPWSREPIGNSKVVAGFMIVHNKDTVDDVLIKATADISDNVQIHEMSMVGDVMKMQELPQGLPIPANGTVALKPKSYHIMFMDVKTHPKQGESFKGTLTFQKAGVVNVIYKVEAPMGHH